MTEKKLLANGVRLVMEEVKSDCVLAVGRQKNTKETSDVLYGFSKYIEGLDDLLDYEDFGIFADNVYAEVKDYLTGQKDFNIIFENIEKYEKAFLKEFVK